MSFVAMIAAGAMALPTLNSPFMRDTMPRRTAMSLLLDPDGIVVECEILDPDWDEDEAERAFKRTLGKRAGGTPAIGPDGEPTYGIVIGEIIPAGERQAVSPPDLEFTVAQLADGQTSVTVHFLAFIDASGIVQKCQPPPQTDMSLFATACVQSTKQAFPVRSDADGAPVAYVDEISVRFVTEAAGH